MEKATAKDLFIMFRSFFKIGAFTIGGGYAMLPLIEREFVEVRGWVTPEEIVDVFAIAQSLPGVIAINTSIFIGYKVAGVIGALVAAAGVILPSFITILFIAVLMINFQDNLWVQRAFAGVRAGVTALILLAGIKLGRAIMKNPPAWVVASLSFIALVVFGFHVIPIILASAFAGLVLYGIRRARRI
jgi:chromate transporter